MKSLPFWWPEITGGNPTGRDHLQRHGWPEAARREVRGAGERFVHQKYGDLL
jgi:hypothetical protein